MAQYGLVFSQGGRSDCVFPLADTSRASRYGGRPNPFDQRDDAPSYSAPVRQPQPAYGQSAPYSGGRDYNQGPSMEGGYAGSS